MNMNKIIFALFLTISNAGLSLEIEACLGCHNPDLKEINPTLHGQHKAYIQKQLKYFKKDKKENAIMQGLAKTLDDNKIKELSKLFSEKEWYHSDHVTKPENISKGKSFMQTGNCARCHGHDLKGSWNIPRLAGQSKSYLYSTMMRFKKRQHTHYPVMNSMLSRYPERDIEVMADYLAGLK